MTMTKMLSIFVIVIFTSQAKMVMTKMLPLKQFCHCHFCFPSQQASTLERKYLIREGAGDEFFLLLKNIHDGSLCGSFLFRGKKQEATKVVPT